ncbi:hypothetical protein PMZ80_003538 [Knufia obscura]|uniref:Uncharacterized protein n=2 Tax=Knufia TaxID=430999 RepID=A0AAN8I7U8_9EURO|nr:hypothetical protein PMZ80_003538 [Knufia obscura]KAK5958547.1 hypothetical protein OHC33_000390 [Knufia fluminis]
MRSKPGFSIAKGFTFGSEGSNAAPTKPTVSFPTATTFNAQANPTAHTRPATSSTPALTPSPPRGPSKTIIILDINLRVFCVTAPRETIRSSILAIELDGLTWLSAQCQPTQLLQPRVLQVRLEIMDDKVDIDGLKKRIEEGKENVLETSVVSTEVV